ncbi:MAG: carboxypeptidase-like regulatory domain-containing protein [Fibrobacteria bacterium]
MRKTFRFLPSVWAAAAAAAATLMALSGCMPEATQGGSDTETLSGLVLTPKGKAAVGARVKLIPSTYDPSQPNASLIREVTTDSQGRYTFPKTPARGSFNILAVGPTQDAAFIASLSADSVPDTLRLEPPRTILVTMYGSSYDYAPGRVWFPGTDILFICNSEASMAMKGLARSLNSLVLESSEDWRHDYTFHIPGDTLVIEVSRFSISAYPFFE